MVDMNYISKIRKLIFNNSMKRNLLGLYSTIVIVMSFLLMTMLFYSIDLNRTSNKIILNFGNYNKIYSQVNEIDKGLYLNITEQKKFDAKYYDDAIEEMNRELVEIGDNFEQNNSIVTVEVLKRTVSTLGKYIDDVELSINNNSSYTKREELLAVITNIKEIIKDNVQELMELNLTLSQKHIDSIKTSYNIALTFIVILFIVAIAASVGFLLFIIEDTVHKINIVSENANKLANGDLSVEQINFDESNEFQILALSFNKMKNNIKDYISKLSSSEMRISSILNAVNDCIITTNSSGDIETCNNAVKKIFSYNKKEVLGHNIRELIAAIDFSRYKYEMFNAQKLIKNVKIIDNKYQIDGMKKDGTIIPVEVSYNEVEIEGQRLITFIIQDITQHKNVEKLKDEFISIVSHELRTPLTSIKGAIGLVAAGVMGELPAKVSEMLKIANNNCSRLSNLINDILDLEKIKAGKMNFDFKEYDVVPIVEEAIASSVEYAKQYKVEYRIVDSIDYGLVNVDRNRLIQVLFNLLSNAAKFSYENSVVNISVARIDNGTIRVNIQDEGIGIPEDFRSEIYNSFSQADSSDERKKGGTGLGLSITNEIVNIMGGKINFDSKLNEGTNFYVDFPECFPE